jgi:hypothetical protein
VNKKDLEKVVVEALESFGGSASLIQVSRHIWENHESELRKSGDLLYTWQYDVRWAAFQLRKQGILRPVNETPAGVWELALARAR